MDFILITPRLSLRTGHPGKGDASHKSGEVRWPHPVRYEWSTAIFQMDLIAKPDSLVKPGVDHLDTRCLILMIHDDSLSDTSKCTVKTFCERMCVLVMGTCAIL